MAGTRKAAVAAKPAPARRRQALDTVTLVTPPPAFQYPTQPHPSVRKVWAVRGFLAALFYGYVVLWFVLGLMGSRDAALFPLAGIALVFASPVLAIGTIVYAHVAWRRFRIEVRDEEVVVHKGIVFRTTTRVPLRKVQDIHVRQGPLLRAFGLASLKLDTAGGYAPARSGFGLVAEGQMPGIRDAHEVAEALMARVKAIRSDL